MWAWTTSSLGRLALLGALVLATLSEAACSRTSGARSAPARAPENDSRDAAGGDRVAPTARERVAAPRPLVSPDIARSLNLFARDLYGKLAKEPGNVAFSPTSVALALGMVYAGTAGASARAMEKLLHLGPDAAKTQRELAELQRNLQAAGQHGDAVQVANRLWPRKGLECEAGFLATLRQNYEAEPEALDYGGDADGARGTINRWVSERTRQRIPELLPEGSVGGGTVLVLTNAVYFKGIWRAPFAESETKPEPFYVAGKRRETAPMMHVTRVLRYGESPAHQAVELAYAEIGPASLAMVLVVPRARSGLHAVELAIAKKGVEAFIETLDRRHVALSVPRFVQRKALNLGPPLSELGMPGAMGACGGGPIDAVLHETFVRVDEKGTEAAAATATMVGITDESPGPVVEVRADHPFLFVIRDLRSSAILFLGRVSDPN